MHTPFVDPGSREEGPCPKTTEAPSRVLEQAPSAAACGSLSPQRPGGGTSRRERLRVRDSKVRGLGFGCSFQVLGLGLDNTMFPAPPPYTLKGPFDA